MRKRQNDAARTAELWEAEQALVARTLPAGEEDLRPWAGVDEAGRGALAGPVVAAAVILGGQVEDWLGIDDSKRLGPKRRRILCERIYAHATAVAVGVATPTEIDTYNILHAARLAMARALHRLRVRPAVALVDGPYAPRFDGMTPISSQPVVGGDARCLSIAAASIVAKVARDDIMCDLDRTYPGYGWERNAGYPTADHLAALAQRGSTPLHRQSFGPVQRVQQVRLDASW
ncbi:MAG: ribonuclease HII [Alicyclobacillus sp.]|nr:ribonuclease HII [Alicyclobacillus sp.]